MIADAPPSETTLRLPQQFDDVTPRGPKLGDGVNQLEVRLIELAELRDGWDGYGAHPVDRHALVAAERLIRETLRAGWPTPELFPIPSGGVQLEWSAGSMELELEIEPGGRGVVFVGDDSTSGRRFDGELPRDAALLLQAATTLGARLRERATD
jgi:hypothetical protein